MGELARRVVVALIAAPLAIAMVWLGELPFAAFLGLAGGLGAWELYRMARHGGVEPMDALGIPLAAAIPLLAHADRLQLLRSPAAVGARSSSRCWARRSGRAAWGAAAGVGRRHRLRRAVHRGNARLRLRAAAPPLRH
ncbi:MAG: hypothetical protein U0164_08905 [Gemmatimonadaceae bacterium]